MKVRELREILREVSSDAEIFITLKDNNKPIYTTLDCKAIVHYENAEDRLYQYLEFQGLDGVMLSDYSNDNKGW